MKTWVQLKTEIRNHVWASGESENLVTQHDDVFQEGAADISKWCECEQTENVNLIQFCKTFYKCGMTVIPAPAGVVTRLFTVKVVEAGADYCDPVFYVQREWPEPERLGNSLVYAELPTEPDQTGKPELPIGFKYADASSDKLCGEEIARARCGIWAIHGKNIFISPWINSDEKIVVEWTGIKKRWEDDDVVNDAQDYRKALTLYLKYGHELYWGSKEEAAIYLVRRPGQPDTGLYADALGDLIWQCREQMKVREGKIYDTPRLPSTMFPYCCPASAASTESFFNPILRGHGDPTEPPERIEEAYLYKDLDSGGLWAWDTETETWV